MCTAPTSDIEQEGLLVEYIQSIFDITGTGVTKVRYNLYMRLI